MRAAAKRTPQRAALADAIGRLEGIRHDIATLTAAIGPAEVARFDCRAAVDKAAEAIEEAKRAAAEHATDKLLGRAGPVLLSIAEAERLHGDAQDRYAAAVRAQTGIEQRLDNLREPERYAVEALDRAVRDVVVSEPATADLVGRYREAKARFLALHRAMDGISSMLPPVAGRYHSIDPREGSAVYLGPWLAAVERLGVDPDAPLPTVRYVTEAEGAAA